MGTGSGDGLPRGRVRSTWAGLRGILSGGFVDGGRGLRRGWGMRSQKQNNRSPRPFNNRNNAPKWTGGSGSTGFIPGPAAKPVAKVKKAEDDAAAPTKIVAPETKVAKKTAAKKK